MTWITNAESNAVKHIVDVDRSMEPCAYVPMTQPSLQKIEKALSAMEAVLERAQGGRADDQALLDFRCRCWELMLLIPDGRCQVYIDSLVQHAKELYSDRDRSRAAALRAKLRTLLADFRLATSRVPA